jgi:hypothetical protein
VLRLWIACFGSLGEPSHRFVRVLPGNLALGKCDADAPLSAPVTVLRLLQQVRKAMSIECRTLFFARPRVALWPRVLTCLRTENL